MKKKFFYSFLVYILCSLFLHINGVMADDLPERLGGEDRFEVAVNVSKKWYGANTVLLVNYNAFADALSAGPLAYKYDAPILLTHATKLTEATKIEIKRLVPNKVVVVGGEASVSDSVLNQIRLLGIKDVERISGKDRFEVSANVAKIINNWESVIIADGLNYPDALSISSYAAINQVPILLTRPNSLPVQAADLIKMQKVSMSLIIGGEASVSKLVERALPRPERIGGKNRFEVAANVYKEKMPADSIYLATGMSFADALTGSVAAAKEKASIVLTRSDFVPSESLDVFENNIVNNVVVLGGRASVSDNAISDIHFHKKSSDPIIYLVPHADDEVLTFGIDILNQLNKNRNVYLGIFSKGSDSVAREIVNGHYDEESRAKHMNNAPIWCWWHGVYHDPGKEGFLHGYITLKEFGDIRLNDYFSAANTLGVKEDHALDNTLEDGTFNKENIKNEIRNYLSKFPDAEFRSMSWHDGHPPHALIGQALKELEESGEIHPLKTTYFISVYTDRFSGKTISLPIRKLELEDAKLQTKLNAAVNIYGSYNPQKGFYATGYHSVKTQFDRLLKDSYVRIHY
ncbi:cell wall-binding repeat-containing protein [Cytobacillus sp. FSL H8-0458]|uniref:cell wall-binding repeat-containing protein n=1 Tax=Cytobacillus sp. FSL H8-0458 TaxID=2975346 RepID=UPI0030FBAAC0